MHRCHLLKKKKCKRVEGNENKRPQGINICLLGINLEIFGEKMSHAMTVKQAWDILELPTKWNQEDA